MAVLQQRVDLDAVTRGWAGMQAPPAAAAVTPFENIADATAASAATKDEWFRTGLDLIARGGAACILMAGGAGTRLGFAQPKGMYGMKLTFAMLLWPLEKCFAVALSCLTVFIQCCGCQILGCRHTRPCFKSKPNVAPKCANWQRHMPKKARFSFT